MRKRWFILAALAGALAAVVVGKWPDRPRWRTGPGAGSLGGFSPDGRTVVTFSPHPDRGYPRGMTPVVCRWDAATGTLLSRAELLCAEPNSYREAYPSADGRRALVRESFPGTDPATAFGNHYLHDAVTGQRLAGPIRQSHFLHLGVFSHDNRWFWGWGIGPVGNNQWGANRLLVFDATTGEQVLELPYQNGLRAAECIFAPDGSSMAVLRRPTGRKARAGETWVQVLELPSGRELRRFDLPLGQTLKKWDGRHLEVQVWTRTEQRDVTLLHSRIYDLAADPVGEGLEHPLLKGQSGGDSWISWLDGPDWIAHIQVVPTGPASVPSWLSQRLDQVARSAGFRYRGVRVTLFDRGTGNTRSELPEVLAQPCALTPDGRLLVCPSDDGGIEGWDTEPRPPRWPWALLAGILAAGPVLVLGRYRRPGR